MTVIIPLNKGLFATIDDIDSDLTEFKWVSSTVGKSKIPYAMRLIGKRSGVRHGIIMHRVILGRMIGKTLTSSEHVDHINGDGLDNRRGNLRIATPAQNMMNAKRRTDNTSGYKGVSLQKNTGKWSAQVWVNGKKRRLGYFNTPELAYEAYCKAAKEYYGEFARL